MGILDAPHDTFFGLVFQRGEVSADWLRSVLPARIVRAIAWHTFTRAPERSFSPRLRRNESDQVFVARLRRGGGRIVFVLEHKADGDPGLRSQTLRYAVDLRHAARPRPKAPEPLVIVVVLHHDEKPWRLAPHPYLAALPAAVGRALDDLQPNLPMVVDDLTRQDEPELRARRLRPTTRLALLCLRFLRHCTGKQVLAAIERWGDLLRAAHRRHGTDIVDALTMYALTVSDVRQQQLADLISRILNRPEDMTITTAQRIYRKGEASGEARGETKGKVDTLLRLLGKRFGAVPATTLRRVRAATAPALDRWIDRILDARTLAEVFER
ncbi:MAG: Rpn family recombination-promoting nuclease/putative transposase [Planctomycetota bacterium]